MIIILLDIIVCKDKRESLQIIDKVIYCSNVIVIKPRSSHINFVFYFCLILAGGEERFILFKQWPYLLITNCFYLFQVRSSFSKIIVSLAHFSVRDGPSPPPLVHGLIGKY